MVGIYHNNKIMMKTESINVIHNWIDSCVIGKKWLDYYDLHIDNIDEFKMPETWIDGGLECLNVANKQVDTEQFEIVLSIPFFCENELIGINFSTKKELQTELSFTPPSLYLFKKNSDHGLIHWKKVV